MSEEKNQVEALLFSGGSAMSVEDLMNLIGIDKRTVKKALKELKEDYSSRDTSLAVFEEGNSWKLNIREKYVDLVTKIVADTELGKPALETLSVIAWKSPVLQSEVIQVRGANAYEHIKEMVEFGFVNKEKEGRSYRLKVAGKFFEYFDVPGEKGIKDVFKEVRVPEKVGDLDVVDIPEDQKLEGEQEVEKAAKSETESSEKTDELVEQKSKEEIPPVDEKFLDKINKQIDDIAKRNDDLDDDELFKRQTSEGEEDEGNEEVEESNGEEQSNDLEGSSETTEKDVESEEGEKVEETTSDEEEKEEGIEETSEESEPKVESEEEKEDFEKETSEENVDDEEATDDKKEEKL